MIQAIWLYKVFDVGGAEQLLVEVAPYLEGDVQVIPVAVDGRSRSIAERMQRVGLDPIDLCSTGPFDVSWPARFTRLVRRLRPDVVHVHSPFPASIIRPILTLSRVPIVYTEHNIWPNYYWPTRIANALTYPLNDRAVAVSEAVRASQQRFGFRWVTKGTRVVPNGIDVDNVIDTASEPSAEIGRASYGAVGHLRRIKGVDVLLRAARIVRESVPGSNAYVVGAGEDEASLAQLRAELGLEDHVRFMGYRADARSITAALDVFVVPSRHEGMPVALLEAMSLARPIVATAVGGIPEMLTHGDDALLVPPDDPPRLADAITQLLADRERAEALGRRAHGRVRERYGADRCARSLVDLYRSVTGR